MATEPRKAEREEIEHISCRTKLRCYYNNRRYREGDYVTYVGPRSKLPSYFLERQAPKVDEDFADLD